MTETCRGFSSVYHSLDAILAYLKNGEFAQMPEVQKLLAIFSDNYPERSGLDSDVLHSHPFIVFEGLDGAGKTTNVKKLTEFLQGQTVSTPPNCMLPLRDHFNQQPAALKRAYYGLGNYIAGRHVETLLNSHAVIMDRFWHSTAAYAIAEEVKTGCLQLPQEGDPLYRWPSDLVKPDLVLFLELDESARSSRHRCRNTTNTEEEQQLLWDNLYRESTIGAYRRIAGVPLIAINASMNESKVFEQVQQAIQQLLTC
ncbi:UMP-CMP kinase 2, mitochondrial-like isoform X2 [Periplaneta americana]